MRDISDVIELYDNALDNIGNVVHLEYNEVLGFGHTVTLSNDLADAYVGADKLKSESELSDYDFMNSSEKTQVLNS